MKTRNVRLAEVGMRYYCDFTPAFTYVRAPSRAFVLMGTRSQNMAHASVGDPRMLRAQVALTLPRLHNACLHLHDSYMCMTHGATRGRCRHTTAAT